MIVKQFLEWMQTAPLDGRCRATAALARSFLVSDVSDADREELEATLTVLLDDPEPEIRRVIAEVMAPSRNAPRHLILTLAEGPPEIATIVLAQSPVLIEAELVEFIAEGSTEAQVAIASRPWLSPGVSAALAEVGEHDAIVMLALNPTASIPVFSLAKMAERFGWDAEVRQAMLDRAHLPIEVRHMLMAQLSMALAELSSDRHWMREERVVSASIEAKDKTTVQMAAAASSDELPALVEHLRATGQLTTTLLLRAVTLGDVRFLKEAMALLSGLPKRRVEALIIEGRESACRALFEKAGLPARVFPAFIAALDVQRELAQELGLQMPSCADDHRFAHRVVERVLTRCRAAVPGEHDDLIVLLRRFATEAARDAARALIETMSRQPPLALPAPDHIAPHEEAYDADARALGADDIEAGAPEIDVMSWDDADLADAEFDVYPVYAQVRAA